MEKINYDTSIQNAWINLAYSVTMRDYKMVSKAFMILKYYLKKKDEQSLLNNIKY